MKNSELYLSGSDDQSVYLKIWQPENGLKPKLIIQLVHGMAEHINRYDFFANYFVNQGFIVAGNDHKGHGKTVMKADYIGYFSNNDGWFKVVEDLKKVNEHLKNTFPGIPVVMLGHSMGSFLARTFICKYPNEIDLLVLTGTGGNPGLLGQLGKFLARTQELFLGAKHKSITLNFLSFGSFNSHFKPNRTLFDWLCTDPAEVDKYIADPYCGAIFSCRFFYDMLVGLQYIYDPANSLQIFKKLPLLLLSGEMDPVGDFTKGVEEAKKYYLKSGLSNIQSIYYPQKRHEILNETNKEEVFQDIKTFIDKNLF